MIDSLSDLLPMVTPDAPGAPDNVITLRLREAFKRFCTDTEAWREDYEVSVVADQADYAVSLTNDAMIKRIVYVRLKSSTSDNFDSLSDLGVGTYKLDNQTLSFYDGYEPGTAIVDGLRVRCAIYPTMSFKSLDDDFLERYADGVVNLAKYFLLKTPGKQYSNPQYALSCYHEYRNFYVQAVRENTIEHKNQYMQMQVNTYGA